MTKPPELTDEQYDEISEAIGALGEVFQKHGVIGKIQVDFDTFTQVVECNFITEEGESNGTN